MDNDILAFFEKMYLTRPRDFGNAREVRNAYTAACQRVTDRMALNPKSDPYITISDLDPDYTKQSATNIDDALSKLDGFIGMESVKKQLRSLANKIKIDRMRAQRGGRMVQPNVHIVITGTPGQENRSSKTSRKHSKSHRIPAEGTRCRTRTQNPARLILQFGRTKYGKSRQRSNGRRIIH